MAKLKVKLLNENGKLPTKANKDDAGYDLYAAEPALIYPNRHKAVSVALSIELPPGTYGRIAPRSGLAVTKGLGVLAGVVDRSYTGEIKVVLINHGITTYSVAKGDRIAQLIVEKIEDTEIEEVKELKQTNRGSNGFGSSGV